MAEDEVRYYGGDWYDWPEPELVAIDHVPPFQVLEDCPECAASAGRCVVHAL